MVIDFKELGVLKAMLHFPDLHKKLLVLSMVCASLAYNNKGES